MLHNISDKLIALNYPYAWDDSLTSIEKINPKNLLDITVFLEDTILRTLPIASRKRLKDAAYSKNKEEIYSAIHDYVDSENNTNILKLHGGAGAFDKKCDARHSGMCKLLNDLKSSESNSDLAAVVLIDRLLDLAITQQVHDQSMDLEAAHAKWTEEQGKRNVSSLDLSASLQQKEQNQSTASSSSNNKSSSSSLSKFVSQILTLRNQNTTSKNEKSDDSLTAQIGAASRFAMGLVDYDAYFSTKNEKSKNTTTDSFMANLDEEWTKLALSEVPLFSEERIIYDYRTSVSSALNKKKNGGNTSKKAATAATTTNQSQPKDEKLILLQDCARALRAMYTEDFSALQRRINVSLARLQELTATCATDAKLGRTGR